MRAREVAYEKQFRPVEDLLVSLALPHGDGVMMQHVDQDLGAACRNY